MAYPSRARMQKMFFVPPGPVFYVAPSSNARLSSRGVSICRHSRRVLANRHEKRQSSFLGTFGVRFVAKPICTFRSPSHRSFETTFGIVTTASLSKAFNAVMAFLSRPLRTIMTAAVLAALSLAVLIHKSNVAHAAVTILPTDVVLQEVTTAATTGTWKLSEIPKATRTNPLVDPNHFLNASEVADLTERVKSLQDVDARVVIVRRLNPGPNKAIDANLMRTYADTLRKKWGVGVVENGGSKNGVLALLSIEDRKIHISTSGVISDSQVISTIDNMKGSLRGENYGDAIIILVDALEPSTAAAVLLKLGKPMAVVLLAFRAIAVARHAQESQWLQKQRARFALTDLQKLRLKPFHRNEVCPYCVGGSLTTDTTTFSCGHRFHSSCLLMAQGSLLDCPVCRDNVDYHPDLKAFYV